GASAVDTNEPIAFRPAYRGLRQRNHFFIRTEMFERSANRIRRHRLEPQPFYRLFHAAELDEIPKDELAFAPGVASVDQKIDIVPLHEPLEHVEARFRLLDRLQFKLVR